MSVEDRKIYTYARISTNKEKQRTDRQVYLLEEFKQKNNLTVVTHLEEVISGKTPPNERLVYMQLKSLLKKGDLLILTDLDRLGRDARSTISEVKDLQLKGVQLIILDTPFLDTLEVLDNGMYSMIVDIFITLKAHVAEQERLKISERVKAGMAVTTKEVGRPKRTADTIPDTFKEYFERYKAGNISYKELATLTKLNRQTVWRYAKILKENEMIK